MLRPLTPPAGGPAGGRAGIDLKGATGGGSVPSAGTAAPEPSGTGNSAVREVEIHCNSDGCYSLWAAGGRCAVIADGHTRIIALLAQRVLGAYPSDVVVWRHLSGDSFFHESSLPPACPRPAPYRTSEWR